MIQHGIVSSSWSIPAMSRWHAIGNKHLVLVGRWLVSCNRPRSLAPLRNTWQVWPAATLILSSSEARLVSDVENIQRLSHGLSVLSIPTNASQTTGIILDCKHSNNETAPKDAFDVFLASFEFPTRWRPIFEIFGFFLKRIEVKDSPSQLVWTFRGNFTTSTKTSCRRRPSLIEERNNDSVFRFPFSRKQLCSVSTMSCFSFVEQTSCFWKCRGLCWSRSLQMAESARLHKI